MPELPEVETVRRGLESRLIDATITEMIFVDDTVDDGSYILNLQIASFENDASPSKPIIYIID